MLFLKKSMVMFVFLFLFQNFIMGSFNLKDNGYYNEDDKFVRQRIINPVEQKLDDYPLLSDSPINREKELKDFYIGKVVTTKITIPACYTGVVLYTENLGKTNVEIFKKISDYNTFIEAGDKLLITDFRIKPREIYIELNNGGYGSALDITKRVALDVVTVGLMELFVDYHNIRSQRGSRLVIKSNRKFMKNNPQLYSDFNITNLNIDKFKVNLINVGEMNDYILSKMGITREELKDLSKEKLLQTLNDILPIPDFYKNIDTKKIDLSKQTKNLLEQIKYMASFGDEVPIKKIRCLNKSLLSSVYRQEIREDNFNSLDFESINKYLSFVFDI